MSYVTFPHLGRASIDDPEFREDGIPEGIIPPPLVRFTRKSLRNSKNRPLLRCKHIDLRTITLITALALLSDCQVIGPAAIEHGRLNYTSVIESTSKQQTFDNVIYVHNSQMPEFVDVTAINTVVLSSASLTAGGMAHVGSVSGTLQYQESPTITLTPLYGKTLVDQIVSPISIKSLSDIIKFGLAYCRCA